MRWVVFRFGPILFLIPFVLGAVSCAGLKRSPNLRKDPQELESGVFPRSSRVWLYETVRVRRANAPGNSCLRIATFRKRFFEKRPEAAECSTLFEAGAERSSSWVLHYRLVRRPKPTLQFEKGEGLSLEQERCVKGGALERLPLPSEIAFLAPDPQSAPATQTQAFAPVSSDDTNAPGFGAIEGIPPILKRGEPTPLSCHRMALNLKQDEVLGAKLRLPLMVVRVGALSAQTASNHWLDRLWLAPYLDDRGLGEGWLATGVLPATPCQLCLKEAYRESVPAGWADQLETR